MKRWVIFLLGILVLAFSLAACGDEVAPLPSATSTITPHPVSLTQKAYLPTYQAKVTQSVVVVPAAQATQTVRAALTQFSIFETQMADFGISSTPSAPPTTNSATHTVSALLTQVAIAQTQKAEADLTTTPTATMTLPTATPGLSPWRLALEQRIIDYTTAIHLDPENADAYYWRGGGICQCSQI